MQAKNICKINIISICHLHDLGLIALSDDNGNVFVYNIETCSEHCSFSGHLGKIRSICYLGDCESLISGGDDGTLVKCNIQTKSTQTLIPNHKDEKLSNGIRRIINTYNGESIFFSSGAIIYLFDLRINEIKKTISSLHTKKITCFSFSKGLQMLASGSEDKKISLYDYNQEEVYCNITNVHNKPVKDLMIGDIKGDDWVISCSKLDEESGLINLFDILTKTTIKNIQITDAPKKILYCFDGRTMFIIVKEGWVVLKNLNNDTEKEIQTKGVGYTCGLYLGDGKTFLNMNKEGFIEYIGIQAK